jgi:hypothetical protein
MVSMILGRIVRTAAEFRLMQYSSGLRRGGAGVATFAAASPVRSTRAARPITPTQERPSSRFSTAELSAVVSRAALTMTDMTMNTTTTSLNFATRADRDEIRKQGTDST